MALLNATLPQGTSGWDVVVNANMAQLNTSIGSVLTAFEPCGTTAVVDPTALVSTTLTDSSGGTPDQIIAAVSGTGDDATINGNNSDFADQQIKMRNELSNLHTVVIALLLVLREGTGCGIVNTP